MEYDNNEGYLTDHFRLIKRVNAEIESFTGADNNIDQIMRFSAFNKIAKTIAAAPISSIACCHIKLRFVLFYPIYEAEQDNPAFQALLSVSEFISRID